ncbi:sulfurtransferase complex subunit TusC [Pseudomonas sp. EpS/L25]|uniref:sulfurtransferase complex subunit TusC n=1 Tax=Pseudomonas sp. EpS/L25 TaxID=1749078 RepID=UPI000744557E|nr:sulfurtransferase complex subunit TusC [Pseudomonas sp. EpS/L25]KUM34307.1 sulfur relay protein TusC [Pseudomonas sp. EpS/L25]
MAKSTLVITRQPALGGLAPREALDIVLAGGAFELPLALLFAGPGVTQLLAVDSATLEQKDLSANLSALPLFGVEAIYAEAAALQRLGITPEQLPAWVTPLAPDALAALIHDHDQVISI